MIEPTFWRKCTTCKKPIDFGKKYWICSVSTCNRVRTDLVFCDLRCFDAHVPVMNHRDAGAFEKIAPTQKAYLQAQAAAQGQSSSSPSAPKATGSPPNSSTGPAHNLAKPTSGLGPKAEVEEDEVLVVVSKVKAYIRTRSGMNTSDAVMEVLSDKVRRYADQAIRLAEQNNRKTVLDRDVR